MRTATPGFFPLCVRIERGGFFPGGRQDEREAFSLKREFQRLDTFAMESSTGSNAVAGIDASGTP